MSESRAPVIDEIRHRLQVAFAPQLLAVTDEGHRHAGHAGEGKGHFHVRIVSDAFGGQTTISRHRMIYQQLADLMEHGIHALSIDANSHI